MLFRSKHKFDGTHMRPDLRPVVIDKFNIIIFMYSKSHVVKRKLCMLDIAIHVTTGNVLYMNPKKSSISYNKKSSGCEFITATDTHSFDYRIPFDRPIVGNIYSDSFDITTLFTPRLSVRAKIKQEIYLRKNPIK